MKKLTVIIGLTFILKLISGQEMQKGFEMLDKGNFADAEIFFENILEEFPENKTANICYGRAVGLNGNPEQAIGLFSELMNEYPGDVEVELNYAESLLWGKQYKKAEKYYAGLVKNNPENFAALLGYANTFSNLKEYENALSYVNQALDIQPGNPNAMNSKKYIRLGYAYQQSQNQNYEKAENILFENLNDFPGDKEILKNLANLYLIMKATDKATETYRQMAINYTDSIEALNGMALAAHLAEKNKTALELAKKSRQMVRPVTDSALVQQTEERYIQALIWNNKFSSARKEIDRNQEKHGNQNWVLALRATHGMYTSRINQSISAYEIILEEDSASFDGNLGIANAYFANGEYGNSYRAVQQTLGFFTNQPDAVGLLKKLDNNFSPFIEENLSYSFDNGKNISYTSRTSVMFPISLKLQFLLAYQFRIAENSNSVKRATTNNFELGVQYQVHPKIKIIADAGVTTASSFNNNYNQFIADLSLNLKPFRMQNIDIGYKREMQNYNADLIDSEIQTNHYYLNYNLSTNFKLGWFTQIYYTSLSDKNARNLLFTSLYYNFLSKPVFKAGFNYQNIGFKNQVPEIYFSPEKFNAVEVFIDFMKDVNISGEKGWFYGLSAATGFQYIEELPKQSTYRVHAKLGYKSSDRLIANFYGKQSNIASATAAGYTFTEFGFRIKWLFTGKPVFKIR